MDKPSYYSIDEAVNLIDSPNKEICYTALRENKSLFSKAKGSKTKLKKPLKRAREKSAGNLKRVRNQASGKRE